ncbi:alanyl-tRNA editing protein [Bradyrhizobium sp. SSBR45G]|uniref:alanyl-tRNA editing protein n=1 Tax=unclassified Bradyrhizobium TaxID=2631580 RepID=UPI00234294DC|nr:MULTISPECIES: alanyl-tRNA editing protein [unclassified Bradyrhizobium]GLH77397.1 alanyl-tRNA editing protein [Bradyrhizobium sp. SSBR45G]GLH84497.1 alanyl-tRNA editing protein [Bradyrhizobium sp. SSBR45R]
MTAFLPRPFAVDHPDVLELEVAALAARPGAVLLARSPFYPGGGGQLPDRGTIGWNGAVHDVIGLEPTADGLWHLIGDEAVPEGSIALRVDRTFRQRMCEQHTVAHLVNSAVYTLLDGALLTGVRMTDTDEFSVDFDLPKVASEQLRAVENAVNAAISDDRPVRAFDMDYDDAQATAGLFRAKSVAPPRQADGLIRIVDIDGLDRQACGGTHLVSTAQARRIRILKVDNKGRQNRRLRIGLASA